MVQAFRLEEASVGWAQFVHPENSSSNTGSGWLSNCVVEVQLVVYGSMIFYWVSVIFTLIRPSVLLTPEQGQGWGRLGVNTLMNS